MTGILSHTRRTGFLSQVQTHPSNLSDLPQPAASSAWEVSQKSASKDYLTSTLPGEWQLKLDGKISDIIPQGEFEYSAGCHNATYTDANGNVYTGIPLWRLMGWVDDRIPHGPDGFNDAAAITGYKVIIKAGDGYTKEFTSQQIGKNDNFIIANTMNGAPLPTDGSHPPFPLRLVGSGPTGGNSVGNVVEIQLTDFQTPVEAPKLHIIKYAGDGTTIINETYVDYTSMENNLPGHRGRDNRLQIRRAHAEPIEFVGPGGDLSGWIQDIERSERDPCP